MPDTAVRFHPSLEHLLRPIEEVRQLPGNPRNGDVDLIAESLLVNGMFQPVVAQQSTGYILAGNHRYAALLALGETRIPVLYVDVSDEEATRIALADNRTSDLARYDEAALIAMIQSLGQAETALLGTGYDQYEVDRLIAVLEEAEQSSLEELLGEPEEVEELTGGERLALLDVTFGEPQHKTHRGEVWRLGRHTLVVSKLHTEHAAWSPHLTPEHVFVPYPDTYVTCTALAQERPYLLVQPNVFLAGHLLDVHAAAFPEDEVEPWS